MRLMPPTEQTWARTSPKSLACASQETCYPPKNVTNYKKMPHHGRREVDITESDITESAITEFDITDIDITESAITETDITRKWKVL